MSSCQTKPELAILVGPSQDLKSGSKMAEGLGKGSAIGGGVGAALAAVFAVGSSIADTGCGSDRCRADRCGAGRGGSGCRNRRLGWCFDRRGHSRRSRHRV